MVKKTVELNLVEQMLIEYYRQFPPRWKRFVALVVFPVLDLFMPHSDDEKEAAK